MTPKTARTMLYVAIFTLIGFGPIVATGAHPATAGPMLMFADLIIWPPDGMQTADAPATRLLAAICGAVLSGWGFTLLMLVARGLDRAPDLVLSAIRLPVIVWFIADGTASIAAGAPLNILGNLVFLVLFLWPVSVLSRVENQTA